MGFASCKPADALVTYLFTGTTTSGRSVGTTSGRDVVEVVRLGSHHDLVADDGEAVDVSALSASTWRIVLS